MRSFRISYRAVPPLMGPIVLTLACATGGHAPLVVGASAVTASAVAAEGVVGPALPVGWASVDALDQPGTTGGGARNPIDVTNEEDLGDEVDRSEPLVIRIVGTITGSIDVGSNKTIEGAPGAVLKGHLELNGSVNVIVRNLKIVGYNCADKDECKRGKDAITVGGGAHHIWFDHCDISDGSDGNLDIVGGSDYITVSWTKFHYSGRRPGDHQFSSLISSSDESGDTDAGHLKVTFHHCWWADNIGERMPRARFGQIHIFNSLYTAAGNNYCIGAGVASQFLVENTIFSGVKRPSNLKFADAATIFVSRGNLVENSNGALEEKPGPIFAPPYPYRLDPVDGLRASITSNAGPEPHL